MNGASMGSAGRWWPIAAVFGLALGLRAAVIGAAPYPDEGHYAAHALFHFVAYTRGMFTSGAVLPTHGGLELYPLLLSWLYFLPFEPLAMFRVADGIFAALAGVFLYLYLNEATARRWAALSAALVSVFVFNFAGFVEAGGRNPIPAATLCFFAALYLVEKDGSRAFVAGLVMGLGVVLREPFVIFAFAWTLHLIHRRGLWTAVETGLGIALAVLGAFAAVATLKGGVRGAHAIMAGYANTPAAIEPGFNQGLAEHIERVLGFAADLSHPLAFALPLLAVGLAYPLLSHLTTIRGARQLYVFAWLLILAGQVELLIKLPFAYHLAQLFLGGAILVALGFDILGTAVSRYVRSPRAQVGTMGVLVTLHLVGCLEYARILRYSAGWSLHFAPVTLLGRWDSPVVQDSFFLKLASIARKTGGPSESILSDTLSIYPLTGRLPPSRQMASLGWYLIESRKTVLDAADLQLIAASRPGMLILGPYRQDDAEAHRVRPVRQQLLAQFEPMLTVGPRLSPIGPFVAEVLRPRQAEGGQAARAD